MAKAHKYPPWKRAILVPFWTLQILFMLIIIGLLALAVGVLLQYDENEDYGLGSSDSAVDAAVNTSTKIVAPVWISLSAICLISTITEIVLLTRRKLSPRKFLIFNVIKSTIWTVLFALDVYAWATTTGRRTTAIGVVIDLALVLSFWIPLIYGSIVFHRTRKQKKSYNPVANPAAPTPYGHPPPIDLESVPYPSQTGYDPRYENYKQGGGYGDVGMAHVTATPQIGVNSPHQVPQVFVQHHDVYEIDNARRTLH